MPEALQAKHDALVAARDEQEARLDTLTKNQSLALRVANKTKTARAAELMKKWDVQGTGVVNIADFRTNIRGLGLKAEVAPAPLSRTLPRRTRPLASPPPRLSPSRLALRWSCVRVTRGDTTRRAPHSARAAPPPSGRGD